MLKETLFVSISQSLPQFLLIKTKMLKYNVVSACIVFPFNYVPMDVFIYSTVF